VTFAPIDKASSPDGTWAVVAAGESSEGTAPELWYRIGVALSDPRLLCLVVDLAGATWLGSAALSVLIGAVKALRDRGGRVVLVGTGPEAMRCIKMCCLGGMFDFEDSADAAIAAETRRS
jgi:anti-anti-sigma factor